LSAWPSGLNRQTSWRHPQALLCRLPLLREHPPELLLRPSLPSLHPPLTTAVAPPNPLPPRSPPPPPPPPHPPRWLVCRPCPRRRLAPRLPSQPPPPCSPPPATTSGARWARAAAPAPWCCALCSRGRRCSRCCSRTAPSRRTPTAIGCRRRM
jgi:hypothetical protein